jgi:hypothetical protein
MLEAHHGRDLEARPDTADKYVVILDYLDFILKPENEGLLPRDDLHGLIAGV